jgi:TetR/AcrR family transcriptional regulator, transcriptional repressor for nem operon
MLIDIHIFSMMSNIFNSQEVYVGTSQIEKQRTHAAILDAAASIIRADGLQALTIANVMSAVGLTHGGFYAHFRNRDELLSAAASHAFTHGRNTLDSLAARLTDLEPLDAFLAIYLSRQHITSPNIGCAAATLGTDSARSNDELAEIFANGINGYLNALQKRVNPSKKSTTAETADDLALLLCASIGAVVVARASRTSPLSKTVPKAVRSALQRRVLPHLETT